MKDALGHGSDGHGASAAEKTQFNKALNDYAAHQSGVNAAAPNQPSEQGRALYASLMAAASRRASPHVPYTESDLAGLAGFEQGGAEIDYPDQAHLLAVRNKK